MTDTTITGSVTSIDQALGDTLTVEIPAISKSYSVDVNNGQFVLVIPEADLSSIVFETDITITATNAAGSASETLTIERAEGTGTVFPLSINSINDGYINAEEGNAGVTLSGTGTSGRTITFSHSTTTVNIADVVVGQNGIWTAQFQASEIQKTSEGTGNTHTITADDGTDTVSTNYEYHSHVPTTTISVASIVTGQAFSFDVDTSSSAPDWTYNATVSGTGGDVITLPRQVLSTKPATFTISAEQNTYTGTITIEATATNQYRNGSTNTLFVSPTTGGGNVFACNGIDVYSRYLDGATPAGKPNYTPTTTVTTQTEFINACNSLSGTGGVVYIAAGVQIPVSTCRISGVSSIFITTDPDNPGGFIGGGLDVDPPPYSSLIFHDCHGIELSNFTTSQMSNWGLNIGGDPGDNPAGVACTSFQVKHIESSYNRLVGIKVTSNSNNIHFYDCSAHHNGRVNPGTSGRGENWYLGDGNTPSAGVYNISLTRCKAINSNGAENCDIKRHSHDITLQYCEFANASVWSQGALTIAINDHAVDYDANIVVKNCLIYGTVTEAYNGHGIVVGLGSTRIEECIIWQNLKYGISVYHQFNGPNDNLLIKNNIIYNNGSGAIDMVSPDTSDTFAPVVTREGNIVDDDAQGTDCLHDDTVFVGPTTGYAAVSGLGVGSGFYAAGAPAPAGTLTLDVIAGNNSISYAEKIAGVTLTGTGTAGRTVTFSNSQAVTISSVIIDGDGNWTAVFPSAQIDAVTFDTNATMTVSDSVSTAQQVWQNNSQAPANTFTAQPAINAATSTSTELDIGWSTSDPATGELRYSVNANMSGYTTRAPTETSEQTSHEQRIPGTEGGTLPSDTDIYLQAVAWNAASGSVLSDIVMIHTEAAVVVPTVLTLDDISGDGIITEAEADAGVVLTGEGVPGRWLTFTLPNDMAIAGFNVPGDGYWSVAFPKTEIEKGLSNTAQNINIVDGYTQANKEFTYQPDQVSNVFACNGIDVYSRYLDGATPAGKPNYTPTTTVTTQTEFINACSNLSGTGGVVYIAAGVKIPVSTCRISGVSSIFITTDPDNPGGFEGGGLDVDPPPYSSLIFHDCHGIELSNFTTSQMSNWGLNIGGDPGDNPAGVACTSFQVKHIESSYNQIVGIKVTSGSNNIHFYDCSAHHNGRVNRGSSGRGENWYLGDGNTPSAGVHNISLTRCKATNSNGAENCDIKRHSHDITLQYCEFANASVWSQGALTIAINDHSVDYDANILVKNCLIYGTVIEGFNGHGIVVGLGHTQIEECIIWDNFKYGISVYHQFNGPNDTLLIKNNIIFNNGSGAIDMDSPDTSDTSAPVVTREGNIVDVDAQGTDCLHDASVFVGPTTGTAAASSSITGTIHNATYSADTGDGSAQSLEFTGTGSGVNLGGIDVAGTGLTLAAWVKADAFPGNLRDPYVISKSSSYLQDDHIFSLGTMWNGDSQSSVVWLATRIRIDGTTLLTAATDDSLTLVTDTWTHVAVTHDGATVRLYKDGVEIATRSQAGTIDQDPTVDVWVGAREEGKKHWPGKIDDVIIAERAFTAAEITNLYNAVPVTDGVVAHLPLDDGQSPATGISGNGGGPGSGFSAA